MNTNELHESLTGHQGKSWGPQRNMLDISCLTPCFGSGPALTLCWASEVLESTGQTAARRFGLKRLSCCGPGRTSGYSDYEAYQRVASPLNGGSVYKFSVHVSAASAYTISATKCFKTQNDEGFSNTDCSCMFL